MKTMFKSSHFHKSSRTAKILSQSLQERATHSDSGPLLAQSRDSIGAGDACQCQKPGPTSLLPLCMLIPRQVFGSSYYTTPIIVLLRLLFPASSYQQCCAYSRSGNTPDRTAWRQQLAETATCSQKASGNRSEDGINLSKSTSIPQGRFFGHLPERLSTVDFLQEIAFSSSSSHHRVVSVTWVKALASNMSHEFIQFVVEDIRSGRRDRLLSDRQETGDWVIIPSAGTSTSSKTPWHKLTPYKRRHTLPLPLISITFDEPRTRPSLLSMTGLLVEITKRCPAYNPMREMCWWFSEAVIDTARSRYQGGKVKEWKWAKFRYSFVLCNNWVRRKALEADAASFEVSCSTQMVY